MKQGSAPGFKVVTQRIHVTETAGQKYRTSGRSRDSCGGQLADHAAGAETQCIRTIGQGLDVGIDGLDLGDQAPEDFYDVVLREVEMPLLAEVLRHCGGNQSCAAAALGINRATLRKKLKLYGLG